MGGVQHVLYAYAFLLLSGGFTGFAMGGYAPKAGRHAMIVGGCGVLSLLLGIMSDASPPPKKGEGGYGRWMVGVHLGLLLPLVLAPLFAWRAHKAAETKPYLVVILGLLALASVGAFAAMLSMKPKKKGA